ncbi:MAG: hypothetical protein FWE21_09020 [Defluviitaleaceae bacterium]|nr:hypothetical protein [Defluviitaleaceae bacterium]
MSKAISVYPENMQGKQAHAKSLLKAWIWFFASYRPVMAVWCEGAMN